MKQLAILVLTGTLAVASHVPAQPPVEGGFEDFADPASMMQRFFGPDTPQEEEALSQVEVSARREQAMGQAAVRAYLRQLKQQGIRVVSRGRDVDYLRRLTESIRPRMENAERYPTLKVHLARSGRCDARVFPGGTLVFHDGLFEAAESEAALVVVVGHELAHLDQGHLLKRTRRWELAQQKTTAGQWQSPADFLASGTMMMRLFTRPFQPEDETEADQLGTRWAYQSGYDPREVSSVLFQLRGEREDGPEMVIPYLQSHPAPQNRWRVVQETYAELQRTDPRPQLYVGQENLRRRVARPDREFLPAGD